MQNQEERLVLIDLAFAGPLGSHTPEGFPKYLFPENRKTAQIDRERVHKWGNTRG